MIPLPKEHGAYGQLVLPLVTAFSVAGISRSGLLLTASAVAAFVAHEPASILIGTRGTRARRELRRDAIQWLAGSTLVAVGAGALAALTIGRDVRWSILIPTIPTALLAVAIRHGREKSWYGESAAALAFASLAVPIAMAAGAPLRTGVAVAVPFAVLFVTSTLAVRIMILRVRGGGNAQLTATMRRSVFVASGLITVCLSWLAAAGVLPAVTLAAAAPGLLAASIIAARPPQPAHLRRVGWTLVAVSVLTAAIVVATT